MLRFIFAVVFQLCFSLSVQQYHDDYERLEFEARQDDSFPGKVFEFTNIVVDDRPFGQVYIGARNHLYQLEHNLVSYTRPIVTGPVKNNIVCNCERSKPFTDNLNKLLLIDYHNSRIIVCGSVEEGICELRQLENLNKKLSTDNISNIKIKQHVAAGDSLSTVGYLATLKDGKEYMFVGSSKTEKDVKEYKSYTKCFTISKRALPLDPLDENLFSTATSNGSWLKEYGIEMKESYANRGFRLNFIDAFANDATGYFIFTRPSSGSRETTYISQVCLEDSSAVMLSNLELPIECNVEGIRYTKAVSSSIAEVGSILHNRLRLSTSNKKMFSSKVLFVSFVRTNGRPGSAVCMFPLEDIERLFVQMVEQCMHQSSREQAQHIPWIHPKHGLACIGNFEVETPVCRSTKHLWVVAKYLEGNMHSANGVFLTNETIVTSIAIAQTMDDVNTVAFFGTEDGNLLKVKIDSDALGSRDIVQYAKVPINPSPSVNAYSKVKKLLFGVDERRLYALTPSLVVGLPTYNCSEHKTCDACLAANDPFCGWCTLQAKCSSASECDGFDPGQTHRYIKSGQCPSLSSDSALVLNVAESQEQISLIGHSIPLLQEQYFCRFGNIYRQMAVFVERTAPSEDSLLIRCVSPPKKLIPKFPESQGHLTLPLSLEHGTGSDSIELATVDFVFYNCSAYNSCTACVKSNFNCFWCVQDSMCYQSTSYCPQGNVHRASKCPHLEVVGERRKQYLPADLATDLFIPVRNIPSRWRHFQCEVRFGDERAPRLFDGVRSRHGSSITCKQMVGSLPDKVRYAHASLEIVGKDKRIVVDNPKNLTIEVYRCELGQDSNCGSCLQSPVEWACGWCDVMDECTMSRVCPASDWLENSGMKSCRNPKITGFSPKTAPFGGNSTVVSLRGINFDLNRKMMVTIASSQCRVLRSDCCEAECIPFSHSVSSGQLRLCITTSTMTCVPRDDYLALSAEDFRFVDPQITSFRPTSGLSGWGTVITVYGEHLDTGNDVLISVDGSSCVVERRSDSVLQCRLACRPSEHKRDVVGSIMGQVARSRRSPSTSAKRLTASFDGVHRVARSGRFRFEELVVIDNVDPLHAFRSGGTPLRIHGRNLGLVPNPRIRIQLNGVAYDESCMIHLKDSIICYSPDVTSAHFNIKEGVVEIYNDECDQRSVHFPTPLQFVSDPELAAFDGTENTKVYRNELLYITGKNLCPDSFHCDVDTVRVLIGRDISCNITRLDMDQITCLPEDSQDIGSYPVEVSIGGYSQHIGYLEYKRNKAFPTYLYGVLVGVALLLLLIIICVVCVYRGRAKASDEELKNVQKQMDMMDVKVAKICKEAFAELQTDMCQLDTHAGGSTIPFLNYQSYLMRVLFPDPIKSKDLHQQLLSRDASRDDTHRDRNNVQLRHFDLLLENKIFLLSFIKALENQHSFQMKDKAQVAGLLMIALHDRLSYSTEILEHLLADLIHRNMEGKNHPKLLLRRTESVAEKMLTHWFSILLHRFVVECAGEPLYTLFRAIKQQVDKGPLDSFTNEAKYSLSEDKLLRQSVEHVVLTLHVSNRLDATNRNQFSVKVLSCDSITQAKRKILDVAYVGFLYSQRPHPEDVDLEFHGKSSPGTLLHDDDSSSHVEAEWKRINTLDHYMVKTGDEVSLVHRSEPSLCNLSFVSAPSRTSLFKSNGTGSRVHHSGGESAISSLSRHKQHVMGTLTSVHNPTKLWHLVKPNDHETNEGGDRGSKMVSEVYLTRLLTTKGTIQKYVDDLFEAIFSVVQRGHVLPLAVKHMFDFLDHQAEIHDITDADVKHTWKSNCLPLRFWVNLIKNPEFVFDIEKSPIVDCYLSVIAQAFMDSCSTAQYKLGKDSPSNKLLYAKEIQSYKQWSTEYYSDVSNMKKLNPRDLAAFLQEESRKHGDDFNRTAALSQLFNFVQLYNDQILAQLDSDPEARRQGLMKQFEQLTLSCNGGT